MRYRSIIQAEDVEDAVQKAYPLTVEGILSCFHRPVQAGISTQVLKHGAINL